MQGCELCESEGGALLWRDDLLRVVAVDEADYPGFCRVILHRHVREMSDLNLPQRDHVMHAVFAVESALRETVQPHKINLASLGNLTPHLHWHIIPRFEDDAHFPAPVWAARKREPVRRPVDLEGLRAGIAQHAAKVGLHHG
jgi:diadenosine tetraphosphate (Ap4A) HIT family hydrolase